MAANLPMPWDPCINGQPHQWERTGEQIRTAVTGGTNSSGWLRYDRVRCSVCGQVGARPAREVE